MDNTVRKSKLTGRRKPKPKHLVKDTFGDEVVVRSRLEIKIAELLTKVEVNWLYETTKIPYTVPESHHKYTVDFTLPNGVFVEGKGILADYEERRKYVLLKEQNPSLDLRFIFQDPNKKCGGMKMTHAEWAVKYGFPYCGINDTAQIISWAKEKSSGV